MYLKYTPNTVFSIKIYCGHFYFESVLFNILGSFRHTCTISYSISTCMKPVGQLISRKLSRVGWIWSLDDPYTLSKYWFYWNQQDNSLYLQFGQPYSLVKVVWILPTCICFLSFFNNFSLHFHSFLLFMSVLKTTVYLKQYFKDLAVLKMSSYPLSIGLISPSNPPRNSLFPVLYLLLEFFSFLVITFLHTFSPPHNRSSNYSDNNSFLPFSSATQSIATTIAVHTFFAKWWPFPEEFANPNRSNWV